MGRGYFLDELIADRQYTKCLSAAEQLLMASGNTIEDLLEINLAIARCRLNMRDPVLALPPIQLARKLVLDTRAYAMMGRVFYTLTLTLMYNNQYDNALAAGYEYFEAVPPSYMVPIDEARIWHGICCVHYLLRREYGKAIDPGLKAIAAFERAGLPEEALRASLVVAHCLVGSEDFPAARHRLATCIRKQRGLPASHWARQLTMIARAECAWAQKDWERTYVLAHRAMRIQSGPGHEDMRFRALMLLHCVSMELQEYKDALGYALAARVTALDARLYWLEYEAAEAMITAVSVAGPEAVNELDREYLATGVDLTRYVSDAVLKSRD